LREYEPIDKALRRLKRMCANEGIYSGYRARKYYEKPSERRRRKAKERMKTIRLANRLREQL
jgi:small subunit ribosomal protein S21